MGLINDIYTGINTRIAVSAPSYTKLSYQLDIAKNKFKGNKKGYASYPLSSNEDTGLSGTIVVNHTFNLTVTDSYNNGAKSQIGDVMKYDKVMELNDIINVIYKDLVINKSQLGSTILVVNELSIEDPTYLDKEKVVIVKATFNVKYKINR